MCTPLALSQLILSTFSPSSTSLTCPKHFYLLYQFCHWLRWMGAVLRTALFRRWENNKNIFEFCTSMNVKDVDTCTEPCSPTESAMRVWVNKPSQAMKLTFDNKTNLIIQYAFLNSPLTSEAKQKLPLSITLILFKLIPLFYQVYSIHSCPWSLVLQVRTHWDKSLPHPILSIWC